MIIKREYKKRKITKRRVIKFANGAISILLSLLLTPFLSTALGLVEMSRYQEVMQITQEIMELVGVSELSDYDKYIHDRFGLLCTTQENQLGEEASIQLTENAKILGKQIIVENVVMDGALSLLNDEVLYHQVVTVGELTAPTLILAEDIKLQALLDKLKGVSQFTSVMNTVSGLADLTDSIKNAVDALTALETAVNNLETSITTATENAGKLAEKLKSLYKKLNDNGLSLPEGATVDEIQIAVDEFCSTYLDDLKEAYKAANVLKENFDSIKSNLTTVKSNVETFTTAFESAQQAVEDINNTNEYDPDGGNSEAVIGTLDDVLKQMKTLVEDTLSGITDSAINTAKTTLNEIIDTTLEQTGLAGVTERYSQIVNGDYFSTPLTDVAKQDLVDLLKTVYTVYQTENTDSLLDYFKDKFIPNITTIDPSDLSDTITDILANAKGAFETSANTSAVNLLTKLVDLVEKIFSMQGIYNSKLNAYVDIAGDKSSPYEAFLNAIGSLFTSIEDFTKKFGSLDFVGALSAMKDMLKSVGDMFGAIMNIALSTINSIGTLVTQLANGDFSAIYERLLIAGYMRHNLPCRTSTDGYVGGEPGILSVKVNLTGTGLTGYDYSAIARPANTIGQPNGELSGFQGLHTFIQSLKAGGGSDKMFKGAELEYILAGTDSEIANQIFAFLDIYFLRLLVDLPSVFGDAEVSAVATAMTIASWIVYILYILIEPLCDTMLLVNGGKVELLREGCWATPTGIVEFISQMMSLASEVMSQDMANSLTGLTSGYTSSIPQEQLTGKSPVSQGGQNYETHMLLMLLIHVDSNTMISRLQDLVELETAEYYRQAGKTFDMAKTYTAVEIEADVTFNSFFDLGTFSGGSPLLPKIRVKQAVGY